VGGDDIQQLAGEDGVDGLSVAVGEAFQGQDIEAGDAHFQVGQAEELGDGVGEVGAEGGSYRFRKRFLRPEVHAERGQLSPRQHEAVRGVHPFSSPTSIHPRTSGSGMQRISARRGRSSLLRLKEKAADVRGGVGLGVICAEKLLNHRGTEDPEENSVFSVLLTIGFCV
jgi:hypothetical protein